MHRRGGVPRGPPSLLCSASGPWPPRPPWPHGALPGARQRAAARGTPPEGRGRPWGQRGQPGMVTSPRWQTCCGGQRLRVRHEGMRHPATAALPVAVGQVAAAQVRGALPPVLLGVPPQHGRRGHWLHAAPVPRGRGQQLGSAPGAAPGRPAGRRAPLAPSWAAPPCPWLAVAARLAARPGRHTGAYHHRGLSQLDRSAPLYTIIRICVLEQMRKVRWNRH